MKQSRARVRCVKREGALRWAGAGCGPSIVGRDTCRAAGHPIVIKSGLTEVASTLAPALHKILQTSACPSAAARCSAVSLFCVCCGCAGAVVDPDQVDVACTARNAIENIRGHRLSVCVSTTAVSIHDLLHPQRNSVASRCRSQ